VEEAPESEATLLKFSLSQNYPNPFNPMTCIRYTVYSGQPPIQIILQIYNIRGQLVRTLVDEPKEAGNYQVFWDGKSDNGKDIASGIYFYELKVGDYSQTKKMVFLK
jgi:5-hydroxyisourate hydrolase-like protein (transthyretin family)